MKSLKQQISSLEDLNKFIDIFLESLTWNSITLLYGEIGVGKTTLVKMLLRKLGYSSQSFSPTFIYLARYSPIYFRKKEGSLFHIDLYRLPPQQEEIPQDIDFASYLKKEEYFLTFIEWPDRVNIDWREEYIYPIFEIHLSFLEDPCQREIQLFYF